ncbi:hypothetical protein BH18ACT10_BH18ACT10_18330 [soil metagenome]|nr:hypothetical protein [Rubrobacter sp.]
MSGNEDYLRSARETFARMSPEGRVRYGRHLGEKAKQQGHDFIDLNDDGIDDRLQDPDFLAHKTAQVRHEQPGLLKQVFGSLFGGRHSPHHSHRSHGHHDGFDLEDLLDVDDFFGDDD